MHKTRPFPKSIHKNKFKPNNPNKKGHERLFANTKYIPEMDADDQNTKYIFEKARFKAWK